MFRPYISYGKHPNFADEVTQENRYKTAYEVKAGTRLYSVSNSGGTYVYVLLGAGTSTERYSLHFVSRFSSDREAALEWAKVSAFNHLSKCIDKRKRVTHYERST